MSAIFGIVRWDGGQVTAREIERMAATLAHRGPDGWRHSVSGPVGLGHGLMRVNREDRFERQPLRASSLDVELVADLRLDNREALAEELGIAPADLVRMPDSAVLLAAYLHWGEACVEHLLGDFAFAIWDGRERRLLLVRDHMGQRGLFFHHGDGFLAFASEAKALWAVEGVPRRLLEAEIGKRLLMPVDRVAGATLYEGITVLPGGELARLGARGTLERRRYWEMEPASAHLGRDDRYYIETYRALLEEAVGCRVRRLEQAPALLFSGGFDSGSIAAMAGPVVAEQGRKLIAIASVLPEGEKGARRDARAAAEAFRTYPYMDLRYFVRRDEHVFTRVEEAFAATDDLGGPSYIRRFLYDIAGSAGARLVLDGMGGDYTVNLRSHAMLGRLLQQGQIRRFLREYHARRRATGRSRREVWFYDVIPALLPLSLLSMVHARRRGFRRTWRTLPIRADFAKSLFRSGAVDPSRLRRIGPARDRWEPRWRRVLYRAAIMEPLQQSLAHARGLDLTRPFHDRRIVEFALAVPSRLHFRNGLERHLAREAFRDDLPDALLRSGPGNAAEEPDMHRMAMSCGPDALAMARSLDGDGRLSRLIDFDKVDRALKDGRKGRPADYYGLGLALHALRCARFIAWFERANQPIECQEP